MKENYQSFWVNVDYTNLMKINNSWRTIVWIKFQLKLMNKKEYLKKKK